jgi:ABC-type amino acid transport substrate-binding protein
MNMSPSIKGNWAAYLALLVSIVVAILVLTRQPVTLQPAVLKTPSSDVAASGKITVAVVPAPPITSFDPTTKQPSGYAVDVINAIARNAKINVEFIPGDWGTMGAALSSGKARAVIGPIFMSEGRAREFIFSDALFAYAVVAVVPKSSHKVQRLEDLKTPGLRLAVGRGGFDAEFVSRFMPQAKQTVFPPDDPNLPALEVIAGRADLALMDFGTAKKFVAEHGEVEMRFQDTPVSLQYAGFMLAQGDTALRDFLNLAMRNLDLSGELSVIDAKYTPQKSWYGRVSLRPTIIR